MEDSDWGKHCIVDVYGCPLSSITDAKNIKKFSKTLVKRIDMVPYGRPKVILFGTGDKEGVTLLQLIETSNITAHFVNEYNSGYIDIFSCKDYNVDIVLYTIREFFQPQDVRYEVIRRKKKY